MNGSIFTPQACVNDAATEVQASAKWMRTDQAALMRQLPEQFSADEWWTSQRDRAPVDDIMPAWIQHRYQVTVEDPPPHLSPAAGAVHQMLCARSRVLQHAPLYVVHHLQLRQALVSLALTDTYRAYVQGWPPLPEGTVHFTDPIPFRHNTDGDDPLGGYLPAASPERTNSPMLRAVTWFTDGSQVRCVDWMQPSVDDTGIADVDRNVQDMLRSRDASLPPMINNGEWGRPQGAESSVVESRDRLAEATARIGAGSDARWDGRQIADTSTLLAPLLAAVTADAINAGLVDTTVRRVTTKTRRRSAHRTVCVLAPARTSSSAAPRR